MPNWDDQGKQYAAFIEAELAAETDRRASVNTRAAAALTGAAGLVTLVLAVFAVLVGKDFVLSGHAKDYLFKALIALLLAAIAALLAGIPWTTSRPSPESLRSFLNVPGTEEEQGERKQSWRNSEVTARNFTSQANVDAIEALRPGTTIKSFFLLIAALLQVVAVMFLVLCTRAVVEQPAQFPKSPPAPAPCCLVCGPCSTTPVGPGPRPDPGPRPPDTAPLPAPSAPVGAPS
jgi:hypothetical protein